MTIVVDKQERLKQIEKEQRRIELEIEIRKISRELARRTTFHYTKYTFSAYKDENWHHKLISDYLHRAVIAKEINRLMIFAPPRHMKSENLERSFSCALGHNPNEKIMITGHSATKADDLSKHIKQNIENPKHYEVFPYFPGINGKNTEDIWEIGNGYRGGLIAGGKTSSKFTGSGFNIAGIDDLVSSREDAESPTFHEKNFAFYASTFLSRQDDPNAVIVIVNTRWHPKDICGRILEVYGIKEYNGLPPVRKIIEDNEEKHLPCWEYNGDPDGEWTILCLPAIMDEEFYQFKHPEDPREPGEALWPQKFPLSFFSQFQKNKHFFNSEYQQRPRPQGGNIINRAWFKPCSDFPRGGKLIRFWDLASTPKDEKTRNNPDFTAGALVTFVGGILYIVDIVATRLSPKQRYNLIRQTAELDDLQYGSVLQVWEEEGGASGPDVSENMKDLLAGHARMPFKEKKNKGFYIETYIANKAETGNVYCVKTGNGKWLIDKCDGNTFYDEAEMWPSSSSHDDRLDAVSKAAYIAISKTVKSFFGRQEQTEYKMPEFDKTISGQEQFNEMEKRLLGGRKIDEERIENIDETLHNLEQLSAKYIELNNDKVALFVLDEMDRLEKIFKK